MRHHSIWIIAALACAAAACKKAKEEPKPAPTVSAPAVVDAGPPPIDAVAIDAPPPPLTPSIPAGKVGLQVNDLEYGGIVATGLPAIKGDGSELVVVSTGEDGGRGYLDVEVAFLDAKTGGTTKKIRIADPEATSAANGDNNDDDVAPKRKELDAATVVKVAELNATLATGDWRALTRTPPLDPATLIDATNELTLGDLTYKVDIAKQVLTISRAGKAVGTHKLGKTYAAPKPADPNKECNDEQPYLAAVFTDATAAKAVLQIGFLPGGHNCGTSGEAYAVVPLPK